MTFVGWKPAYGYTVVIRHGYGYVSQYAHNSKLNVKVGQEVKRGDVIARVGILTEYRTPRRFSDSI